MSARPLKLTSRSSIDSTADCADSTDWGAQATSPPFAAACREFLTNSSLTTSSQIVRCFLKQCVRQAAGHRRLAACAPRNRGRRDSHVVSLCSAIFARSPIHALVRALRCSHPGIPTARAQSGRCRVRKLGILPDSDAGLPAWPYDCIRQARCLSAEISLEGYLPIGFGTSSLAPTIPSAAAQSGRSGSSRLSRGRRGG